MADVLSNNMASLFIHDLMPRDFGSVISSAHPIHYQSLLACSRKTC